MTGVFITGTDTGVGKTWFTIALMQALQNQGHPVCGMKPVACGAQLKKDRLINEDARLIMQHCSQPTAYDLINPAVFEPPVAPCFAAREAGAIIDIKQITANYNQLASRFAYVVVEGVGGWRVPITDTISTLALVRALDIPVIMVVGLRLGCINHALLTAEVIRADGVDLCGWVSAPLEKEYPYKAETIALLKDKINSPNIAELDYISDFDPDLMAKKIDPSVIASVVR